MPQITRKQRLPASRDPDPALVSALDGAAGLLAASFGRDVQIRFSEEGTRGGAFLAMTPVPDARLAIGVHASIAQPGTIRLHAMAGGLALRDRRDANCLPGPLTGYAWVPQTDPETAVDWLREHADSV